MATVGISPPTDALLTDLREFGRHCMAYSALQPGMEHFHLPKRGFVPYMKKWGSTHVLSGGVCADEHRRELLRAFLADHRKVSFVQIYEDDAKILRDEFGFKVTQLGVEVWLDLKRWTLEGKEFALVRRHRNMAARLGIVVREARDYEPPEIVAGIQALKTRWLKGRVVTDPMKFFVRPEQADEPGTRKFIGMLGDRVVSYVVCDPLFDRGRTFGYSINLTSYDGKVPVPGEARVFHGTNYFTVSEIIRIFKSEGLQSVTLGMSPLHALDRSHGEHIGLRPLMGLVREFGSRIYSFKGLARFKNAFHGEERKVYFASRTSGVYNLLAVLRLSNIL